MILKLIWLYAFLNVSCYLVSSLTASVKHQNDIVIGNIVGSNIANIGLIIGISTVLMLIRTKEVMLKRDGYIMLFAACLFYLFIIDANLSQIEALVFLVLYAGYIRILFMDKPKYEDKYGFKQFITAFFHFKLIKAQLNKKSSQIEAQSGKKNFTFRLYLFEKCNNPDNQCRCYYPRGKLPGG